MEERQPRKLAVILHADVVGSTRLVQKNESLAHARIQDAFRRFSSTIEAYNGVTHELRGDALVAEFARASDAVSAGLAFQIENTESNARLEDDLQPRLRIGISLGEVVIADNTVTGAGVVLAQRVEQLAEPGGVCITGAIHEAAPQYLPLDYSDLGKREAKGFEEPVQVYSASVKAGKQVPPPEPAVSGEAQSRKPKRLWTAGAIALLVLIVGGLAWWQPWVQREEPASVERMAFPLPDKPSIAVLPFENMSGDPEQGYFADGMTDDLITDLSKISGLFVIARNSTFVYKGKAVDMKQVGRELGVRYLLEGSVRRAGDTVRINAQLIDTATGGHVWSDRYDGTFRDVFELQDSITRKIVSVLAVQLGVEDRERVAHEETRNAQAYDEFLIGWQHYLRQTPADFTQAIPHFEKAVELDPKYGRAYAALAATYWYAAKRYWVNIFGLANIHDVQFEAERFLAEAMLHPTPLAHHVASDRLSMRQQYDEAISEAEKAIALDPNDADGHVALAAALTLAGRPGEALDLVQRGMRLNPHFPPHYLYELGMARFGLGHLEDAAIAFERALALNPHDLYAQRLLLASYGLLGREADAARLLESSQDIDQRGRFGTSFDPLTVRTSTYWIRFRRPTDAERFAEGLRKAGLPD
jgi:TolB-like protein/class 3 adenylate cyclase